MSKIKIFMKDHMSVLVVAAMSSLVFFCFTSISRSGSSRGEGSPDVKIVDFASNGKTIEMRVEDEIQIELETIGGTGYGWYFDDLDESSLEKTGEGTRILSKEGEKRAGGPVMTFWRLKAKKAGTHPVRMSYYRIWEGRSKAVKKFEIDVEIVP
jgi:predicted secreted protein